jgi:hypothetical protein
MVLSWVALYSNSRQLNCLTHVGPEGKLERWFAQETDARTDPPIGSEVVAFLEAEGVKSVVMTDGLLGCPHEEGIDYPLGESCPECPYWAGRNRFTGERER